MNVLADEPFAILTWNVHGIPFTHSRQRLPRIAAEVIARRPDVVILQEVWFWNQARALSARMKAGGYRPLNYTHGFLRPGGLLVFIDESAGWNVRRVSFQKFRAAAPWWRFNEMDGLARKGYLIADLQRGTEKIRVVDTHLQSQYPEHGRTYVEIRRQQVKQLLGDLLLKEGSVIIGGDFNTTPDEPVYQLMLAPGWSDATAELRVRCAAELHRACGTSFNADGSGTQDWIDYVLLNSAGGATTSELIRNVHADEPFSDHDGVLLTLRVTWSSGER